MIMKITSKLLLISKKPLVIFAFLTIFLVGCSDATISKYDNLPRIDGYKNVVLMIGDGMGINHLKVAEAYNQSPTFIISEAEISGWVKTASLNSAITDSAAAATALSTGIKTRNGNIAYKDCFKLTTMSEYAHAYGMSTGIIATETLTGATPAAFSSHNRSRKNTDHIFVEQIRSNVDIFMGAGKSYYDSRVSDINDQRRPYYTNFEALQNAIDKFVSGEEKLTSFLASFDVISTSSSTASSPSLSDLSIEAISYLDYKAGQKGFFLMVEGSHIDKRAHDKELLGTIEQLNGFDRAVKSVVELSRDKNDTLVIVTADHETGGLAYNNETKSQFNDNMFTADGHTSVNVPFFIYSTNQLAFIEDDEVIENSDIAKIIRVAIRT